MMKEIFDSPLLIGVGIAAAVAIGNYLTSLFTRRRLAVDLETIKLQAQIAEFERNRVLTLEVERAKAEVAREQKVIADALAASNLTQQATAAKMDKKLDELAVVAEATHVQTNSARTAMERVETELRNQLKAQEVAANTAERIATAALQTVKDVAARDLQLERERNAALTQQLAASTPPSNVSTPREPIPVEIVATDPVPVTVVSSDEVVGYAVSGAVVGAVSGAGVSGVRQEGMEHR